MALTPILSTNVPGVIDLPGPVEVLYADNPWPTRNGQMSRQAAGTQFEASRGAARNYRLETYQGLCEIGSRVAPRVSRDAWLLMWVPSFIGFEHDWTTPRNKAEERQAEIREELRIAVPMVAKSYGFEKYHSLAFVWVKKTKHNKPWFGQGYLTRSGAELVFAWKKGKPTRESASVRQVQEFPGNRDQHSRKPPEFLDLISQLHSGIKLEMFATDAPEKPNWFYWGNNCPKSVRL